MSDRMDVPEHEDGVVRVFAVDLEGDALAAFGRRNGSWPLADALGIDTLDDAQVELFAAGDLAGVGVAGYLEDGIGVPKEELAGMHDRLDALDRGVLVVRSRAFGGEAVTLTPRAPLRHVATLKEARPEVGFVPLPAGGATGTLAGADTIAAPQPRGRRWPVAVLLIAVAILALALVMM